jgi:hypothetical protein
VFRRLNDDGRIATATVVRAKPPHIRRGPEGRWVLFYRFKSPASQTVDGAVGLRRSLAAQFHVGQRVDVVFDPAHLSTTALDPEQAWAVVVYNERLLVPFLAILMVLAWNALERDRTRHGYPFSDRSTARRVQALRKGMSISTCKSPGWLRELPDQLNCDRNAFHSTVTFSTTRRCEFCS